MSEQAPPRYDTYSSADLVTAAVHLHRTQAQGMRVETLIERCYTLWRFKQEHGAVAAR